MHTEGQGTSTRGRLDIRLGILGKPDGLTRYFDVRACCIGRPRHPVGVRGRAGLPRLAQELRECVCPEEEGAYLPLEPCS